MNYRTQAIDGMPYDAVVAGGGPAGFAAAVSAARSGLKTLLLESGPCLGGVSTAGVLPFMLGATSGSIPFRQMVAKKLAYKDLPRPRRVAGGIFQDVVDRLLKTGRAAGPCKLAQTDRYPGLDRLGCHDEFTFDIEQGKRVLDEMAREAGVEILFYTTAFDVKISNGAVHGVYALNKSGVAYYPAKSVIDCTGDADLVCKSGFPTYKGDRGTGEMSAAGLKMQIEDVDSGAVEAYLEAGGEPWFYDACKKAREENPELDLPGYLIIFPMIQPGVFLVNGGTNFEGIDGTKGADLTDLAIRGRQRAQLLVEKVFRRHVPGCENCNLRVTAGLPGIRETRRIVGEYTVSEEDALSGRSYEDTIALCGRHFDLLRAGRQVFEGNRLGGGVMQIPYRAMIPKGSSNILAAGRCISVDGQALGPARIMSVCMAVGEAAGAAASFRRRDNAPFANVKPHELREQLRKNGCIVDA
ncbi:MAG: FAD-dependent oxidoreductase [Clostridiales bacterium]|jgi:glycine/D-amino acid oxidase-like deaminating enzyme|nr:FAD-dependent oxidoreductase [Clostridiales bacterium]